MTFDFSPAQQAVRDAAHAFARERLAAVAAQIDETGKIASDVLEEVRRLAGGPPADAVALVAVVEEIAAVSAATAAAGVLGTGTDGAAAPGLRGFHTTGGGDARGRLVLAAVALGIGRAALTAALDALRASARQSQDQEKPHWAVADAATEVAAARVLTMQAAQALRDASAGEGMAAMAKLAAARAAQLAVDVALRVTGPAGFARGALLERLSRDARAVGLLMGTEEDLRAAAASAVLPG